MIEEGIKGELNKLSKSGFIDGVFRILAFALSFVVSISIARIVGAAPIGVVSILISFLTILAIIPTFGLNLGILKTIPEQIAKKNHIEMQRTINGTYLLVVINSLLIISLYWIFRNSIINLSLFKSIPNPFFLDLAIYFLPFIALTSVNQSLFTSIQKNYYATIYEQIIKNILRVSIVFLFISFFSKEVALLYATMLSIFIAFFAQLIIIVNRYKKYFNIRLLQDKIDRYEVRKIFLYSFSLVLIPFMTSTTREIDVWISGALLTSKEVGVYSIIKVIGAVIIFPLLMFGEIFVVSAFKLQKLSHEKDANRIFGISVKWIFICSSFIFCIIFTFGDLILSLFGPDFISGTTVLRIFCFGQLFLCSFGATGTILLMIDKKRILIMNSFLSLVFTILVSIYFIRIYGLMGAAISYMTIMLLTQLLVVYQVNIYSPYKSGTLKQYFIRALFIFINIAIPELIVIVLPDINIFARIIFQFGSIFLGYVLFIFGIEKMEIEEKEFIQKLKLSIGKFAER